MPSQKHHRRPASSVGFSANEATLTLKLSTSTAREIPVATALLLRQSDSKMA